MHPKLKTASAIVTAVTAGVFVAPHLDHQPSEHPDRTSMVSKLYDKKIKDNKEEVQRLIHHLLKDASFSEVQSVIYGEVEDFERAHPIQYETARKISMLLKEDPELFPHAFDSFVEEASLLIERRSYTRVEAALLQKYAIPCIEEEQIQKMLEKVRKNEIAKERATVVHAGL